MENNNTNKNNDYMKNYIRPFLAIFFLILIIFLCSKSKNNSNSIDNNSKPTVNNSNPIESNSKNISNADYNIIDENFRDEGGEYTKLVIWVYTKDMSNNLDIARKIEKDFPSSKYTNKKMWLSINFFTDRSIEKIDPEFGDKIKQLIKIDTYTGKISRNDTPPR